MKKLKKRFAYIDDTTGKPQTDLTVIAYPTGTQANGSTASPAGSLYDLEIDPTSNSAKICSHYDIYVGGNLEMSRKVMGEWVWYPKVTMDADDVAFSFNSINDEAGESLPSTIPNVRVGVLNTERGRQIRVEQLTESGFHLVAQKSGDNDTMDLATNNMDVQLIVFIERTSA